MNFNQFKKTKLPVSSGVYFFKKGKEILYIGKATNLTDRVRSYFASDLIKTRGPAIVDMVFQAGKIDFKETETVLEALLLESYLIKKHQPKYNTKEKDNKSYNSVIITDENIPRIFIFRNRELTQIKNENNQIRIKNSNLKQNSKKELIKIKKEFGPFPMNSQLQEALKIIRKIFPFYDNKKPSNLNIQIGLIPDPEKITQKDYRKNIRSVELFFEGKKKTVIQNLKKELKEHIKKQNFEKAAKTQKQIFAVEHINDISLISTERNYLTNDFRIESYDIAHLAGTNTVGVMTVLIDGEYEKSEYKKFNIKYAKSADDYGALKEVLTRRLKHDEWQLPNLIVVDGGKGQLNVAQKVLKTFPSNISNISVVSVVKDENHKPKEILGDQEMKKNHTIDILKINQETHRFAINFYRQKSRKAAF